MLQQKYNRFQGYVVYLLWHGSRPYYKKIEIWWVRVYSIKGHLTRNSLDNRSYCSYFKGYTQLLPTGNHTILPISTETIILGLMSIIFIFSQNKINFPALYSLNNIQKVLFTIRIFSSWFHMILILHLPYFVIKQWSRMKLTYLLLGRKLVPIYCMKNTLQSLILLVKFQIN